MMTTPASKKPPEHASVDVETFGALVVVLQHIDVLVYWRFRIRHERRYPFPNFWTVVRTGFCEHGFVASLRCSDRCSKMMSSHWTAMIVGYTLIPVPTPLAFYDDQTLAIWYRFRIASHCNATYIVIYLTDNGVLLPCSYNNSPTFR